ncbi:MAG: sigma-54 interaction domain-containing protein [Nitrospiria bacterium]
MPMLNVTGTLIGSSQSMKDIYADLPRIGRSKATILLRGESGTGKELVAKLIHENSPRNGKAFIKVNCAALSESLIESELFGHEKGAFTGATQTKKGRFERADGGTIFLDEVGDLPLPVQVKLLRVLQEMAFERVGGSETLRVDVRTISATHRDLEKAIIEETFRQDLYYRLNVIPVHLPPLRDRKEDIPSLIDYFLDKFNEENQNRVSLSHEMVALLTRYHWPGNVRELENCMERLVVLSEEGEVTLKSIPSGMKTYFRDIRDVTSFKGGQGGGSLIEAMHGMEREALLKALERTGWVQAKAARLLGYTPRQVAYKIKKYKLAPNHLF